MVAQKIGFIGLGDMGRPMAASLLAKGFTVLSCAHRRREAIEELRRQGLIEKANPHDVALDCDIVMTIVFDEAQTETVLRGEEGALAGLKPGSVLVVMSTLRPDYCQDLARELAPREIGLIDCPVSGMPVRAAEGTLALIAGGAERDIETCRAALEAMGTIHHCGGVGLGMVAKLANNTVSMVTQSLVLEVRALARAYGMDMDRLMEVLENGTADCAIVRGWGRTANSFAGNYRVMLKDLGISSAAAAAKNVAMPVLDTHLSKDWAEIARNIREL